MKEPSDLDLEAPLPPYDPRLGTQLNSDHSRRPLQLTKDNLAAESHFATADQVLHSVLEIRVLSLAGEPLAGVAAHVVSSEPPTPRLIPDVTGRSPLALSNADGLLRLEGVLPSTPFHLILLRDDLAPEMVFGAALTVAPPLVVTLRAELSLRGSILDEGGEAVVGARVHIRQRKSSLQTLSNADGYFEFRGLKPGLRTLEVSAPDFRPFRLTALDPARDEHNDLWITLRSGVRLAGTVLDPEGSPLANAMVKIEEPEAGSVGEDRSTRTNSDGFFEFSGLSPGLRTLRATHPNHSPTARNVVLEEGAPQVELRFARSLSITGRVFDGFGLPLSGIPVRARRLMDSNRWTVTSRTNQEGRFVLGSLTPGFYRVRAESRHQASSSQTIQLGPQQDADLEFRLAPGAMVTGVIRGLDPLDARVIHVQATGNGPIRSTQVLPNREFQLKNLPTGTWTLKVDVAGRLAQAKVFIEPWAVEQGAEIPVDLDLRAGNILSGIIHRHGVPLAGTWVSMTSGRFWARVTTAQDGTFRFEGLEDGSYDLGVRHLASGLLHQEPLLLAGDQHVSLDLRPTTVRVVVRDDETGEPLTGVPVQLLRLTASEEQLSVQKHSDNQGRVALGNLGEGRWLLVTNLLGYQANRVQVEAQGQPLEEVELWLERQ